MAGKTTEGHDVYFIPENFQSGITFLGTLYPTRNVIEASLVAAVGIALFFFLGIYRRIRFAYSFIIIFLIAFVSYVLVLPGVKGESFGGYLAKVRRFRKNRRAYYYNPRIKSEYEPIKKDSEGRYLEDTSLYLPIDNLRRYASKLTNQSSKPSFYSSEISEEQLASMTFADDTYAWEQERLAKKNAKKKKTGSAPVVSIHTKNNDIH